MTTAPALAARITVALAIVATSGCELFVGIEDREPHLFSISGVTTNVFVVPVAEAELCAPEVAPDHCTLSNGLGEFTLHELPGRSLQRITVSAKGFLDAQLVVHLGDEDLTVPLPLLPRALGIGLLAPLGFDEKQGAVGYFLTSDASDPTGPGVDEFSITLEPDAGYGPIQFRNDGEVVVQPQTTDTGVGGFINVPAGDYLLRTEGDGNCAPNAPSAALEPGLFLAPVTDGLFTVVLAECKPFF
jgi:hypothetical protein